MFRKLYIAWRSYAGLNYSWRLAWLIATSRQGF
jgi:hypothetical protein